MKYKNMPQLEAPPILVAVTVFPDTVMAYWSLKVPGPNQLLEFTLDGHNNTFPSSKSTSLDFAREVLFPIGTTNSAAVPGCTVQLKVRSMFQESARFRPPE
mmetsp:Transcript_9762/g.12746  ORF Transcript_9762/g.12746 Transcript_9762/m.12746 type:complete len:101 (-) Transcript_9762:150-452(-)